MLDILFKNFRVIDGTGNPWYRADVGVLDGKITRIGQLADSARTIIDGEGTLCLSPGFIDPHAHDEGCLFFEEAVFNKLSQGITTDISGNCGLSLAPVSEKYWEDSRKVFNLLTPPDCISEFTSFDRFLQMAETKKIGLNMGFLVGHGALRIAIMGIENRQPSDEELEAMQDLLREALDNGATGLSFGLLYPPGSIAQQKEFVALCKIVKEKGRVFTIHIRDEANQVIESVAEAIEMARLSGAALNISHHKAIGKNNWGKIQTTLKMIEDANKEGLCVGFDQYPYNANCTNLSTILPPSYVLNDLALLIENLKTPEFREKAKADIYAAHEVWDNYVVNVGFDGMLVIKAPATPDAVGKTVGEYAKTLNQDPFEVAFDLLVANALDVICVYYSLSDDDVETVMRSPYGMIGSDGIYLAGQQLTHPRVKGSFPRVLRVYVREKQVLRLEEAIRKMTSLAAQRMSLQSKGLIKVGFDADLVVFDADTVGDTADYIKNCYGENQGIHYVIVNGKIAVKDNQYTGIASGKIIRV